MFKVSYIPVVRPRPNIRSHSVLLVLVLVFEFEGILVKPVQVVRQ